MPCVASRSPPVSLAGGTSWLLLAVLCTAWISFRLFIFRPSLSSFHSSCRLLPLPLPFCPFHDPFGPSLVRHRITTTTTTTTARWRRRCNNENQAQARQETNSSPEPTGLFPVCRSSKGPLALSSYQLSYPADAPCVINRRRLRVVLPDLSTRRLDYVHHTGLCNPPLQPSNFTVHAQEDASDACKSRKGRKHDKTSSTLIVWPTALG